jgi:Uma2 family endonuclease
LSNVTATLPVHRWSYEEWDQMVATGVLEGKRVELIDGKIVDMSPQLESHVAGVSRAASAMRRVFDESSFLVRVQAPLRAGRDSDPEPDVAVVKGTEEQFLKSGHPTKAAIVIEVSHDSLAYDRNVKASLYASAGIADYWIVNLLQRQCEVRRKPVRDARARFGWRYSHLTIAKSGDSIAPLAAKQTPVAVNELLPKSS